MVARDEDCMRHQIGRPVGRKKLYVKYIVIILASLGTRVYMLKPASVICLMGPTCSGKTDLALRLYEHFPIEIISVDSVMVYRGLDIGTAKPSQEIRHKIPHHLIDIRDPNEVYSAGDFCVDAIKLIEASIQQHKIPLLVGGTMLYYRALQQGLADLPSKDEQVRQHLLTRLQQEGVVELYAELATVDQEAAARINRHDPQRIMRALEVYYVTGKTMSYWWQQQMASMTHYPMLNIGLMPERTTLAQRIAQRFLDMLALGFLEEVRSLYERGDLHADLPAMKSVGYKQAWQYFAGSMNYDEMVERAIIATRQLAKRQFTWLRSWPDLQVVDAENVQREQQIINLIQKSMSSY